MRSVPSVIKFASAKEKAVNRSTSEKGNARSFLVVFQPSGRRVRVSPGTTLLDAARQVGVEIESICGGEQVCGKCRVLVEEGSFPKDGIASGMSHLSPVEERETRFLRRKGTPPNARLACAARVLGDVVITVPPESRLHKQVIVKAAGERRIVTDPAVRLAYIHLPEAELEDNSSLWERTRKALAARFGLEDLVIDIAALRELPKAWAKGHGGMTFTVWQEREVIQVQPGLRERLLGLAVDMGTTTVAGYLCDLNSGQVLATHGLMNPQVAYGEDLMSRVSYANDHPDGLEKLHRAAVEALNRIASETAESAGRSPDEIVEIVLVGNSVIHHLALGLDPRPLGEAPFAPVTKDAVDLKARDLGLAVAPWANLHVLPLEGGHVGADNVAVALAEAPHLQDEMMLILDVGTNGEILLGNRERVLSASSPTGPAFEGAQIVHGMRAAPGAVERVRVDPATWEPRFKVIGEERWSDTGPLPARGICGSGIIEAVAELFAAGVLRPDGRFSAGCRNHPRCRKDGRTWEYVLVREEENALGQEIVVTQADVRAIQLAKAAMYAGAKLLMNRLGVDHVDKVVLAGAFGAVISKEHALILGLFPDVPPERVYSVGNAAGDGARIALLNRQRRREAQELARWIEYVEIALDPLFQEEFVAAMHFPHMRDPFPHVKITSRSSAAGS